MMFKIEIYTARNRDLHLQGKIERLWRRPLNKNHDSIKQGNKHTPQIELFGSRP